MNPILRYLLIIVTGLVIGGCGISGALTRPNSLAMSAATPSLTSTSTATLTPTITPTPMPSTSTPMPSNTPIVLGGDLLPGLPTITPRATLPPTMDVSLATVAPTNTVDPLVTPPTPFSPKSTDTPPPPTPVIIPTSIQTSITGIAVVAEVADVIEISVGYISASENNIVSLQMVNSPIPNDPGLLSLIYDPGPVVVSPGVGTLTFVVRGFVQDSPDLIVTNRISAMIGTTDFCDRDLTVTGGAVSQGCYRQTLAYNKNWAPSGNPWTPMPP